MIAVSPGSSRLTKHASMPADPVPLIGSVSVFVGAEHGAQPVADLVEHDEEVGIEVPEHGALERFHHLGIRVRRAGPEQQPIGVRHEHGDYAIGPGAQRRERASKIGAMRAASSATHGRRCQPRPSASERVAHTGYVADQHAALRAAPRRGHTNVTSSFGQLDAGALRDGLHVRRGRERDDRARRCEAVRARRSVCSMMSMARRVRDLVGRGRRTRAAQVDGDRADVVES